MCSFGICSVATCEKCRPKMLTCPNCHARTYIADTCMFCKGLISKEHQQAAKDEWWRKKREDDERAPGRNSPSS